MLADPEDVLTRLRRTPVYEFNYRTLPRGRRSWAPVAQDWAAAFPSEGKPDTHIETLDLMGVTLAAVQGLATRTDRIAAENARLAARCAALEASFGN